MILGQLAVTLFILAFACGLLCYLFDRADLEHWARPLAGAAVILAASAVAAFLLFLIVMVWSL